jgi:hypothetical protein
VCKCINVHLFKKTTYTVKKVNKLSPSPAGKPGKSLIKLFLAGNSSALGDIFPDQERENPGNPEIASQG